MTVDVSSLSTTESVLLGIAFTLGTWVSTIEFRIRQNAVDRKRIEDSHSQAVEHHRAEIAEMRNNHREEIAAIREKHSQEFSALDAKLDSVCRDLNQLIGRVDAMAKFDK